jgi:hypothetical protein
MPAPRPLDMVPAQLAERVTIAPAPNWVVERSLEPNTPGKAGTNPVLLLDQQYHATRREQYQRTVRRLDTIQAVQDAAQWRQDFDPATERLIIHSLGVSRGGRRVENAKPERLRLLQREENLDQLIIDGLATVVVLLEDARSGDIVDLAFSVQRETRVFRDRFWFFATVPSHIAVLNYSLSVRFATERPMRWKSNDTKLAPATREDGTDTEWTWQASNPVAIEMEPNVPPWHMAERWIQVTDIASWAEVASGYSTAWQETLGDPEVVRLAQSFAAEAGTPAERAIRALNFVQDDIRYLSINVGLGGQIPLPPGSVASRGFGDCKDKTFLATHLLRRLGLSARPVLVNAQRYRGIQEFLPTPDAFDHVVVEYEIGGERRWVDVTVPLQGGTALTRPGVKFQLGLPIGPGVEDLEAIATDTNDDRAELRETFLIDTAGRTSSLKVLLTATGRDAEQWRRRLALEGADVLARKRENFYQQLHPGTTRVGSIEWKDDREKNEFTLGEVFDLEDVIEPTGDGRTCLFKFQAHVIQAALVFHESGKRKNPWALPHPYEAQHIIEIDSPGLTENVGGAALVRAAAFRFQCGCKERQGFAALTYTMRTLVDAVPAAEFDTFKTDVRQAWPNTSLTIRLPLGGVVPWKKRSPENLLPAERKPGLIAPRRASSAAPPPLRSPAGTLAEAPTLEIAPALPSNAAGKTAVTPRKERNMRKAEPHVAGERHEFRRPNPAAVPPPLPGTAAGPSRSGRSRRRRPNRGRERTLLTLAIVLGAAIILGMVVALLHFL